MFRSHLLSLFTTCRLCHQLCTSKVTQQIGSFISIKQIFFNCGHKWSWYSQPFVKDRPAGNILLSAAILFSGSKIFLLLNFLRLARFTDQNFYIHQTEYLEPAVISVCMERQTAGSFG